MRWSRLMARIPVSRRARAGPGSRAGDPRARDAAARRRRCRHPRGARAPHRATSRSSGGSSRLVPEIDYRPLRSGTSQLALITVDMPRAKWLTTVPSSSVSTVLQNKVYDAADSLKVLDLVL